MVPGSESLHNYRPPKPATEESTGGVETAWRHVARLAHEPDPALSGVAGYGTAQSNPYQPAQGSSMKMLPLQPRQMLNLVNTDQVYRAWLDSQRDSLALSLRRQASRNRRVGLGTIPLPIAQNLRQSVRKGTALVSCHAMYAYAMVAAAQLAPLEVMMPVATIPCQAARTIVGVDQVGFAVLLLVVDPIEYVAHADPASAHSVKSMISNGLLPPKLPPLLRA